MRQLVSQPEIKLIAKVVIALSFLFLLFLFAIYYHVKYESYAQITQTIQKNLEQIAGDIHSRNGKLDARMYYQDSTTPLDSPLYILTTNGFVIERMNPINGLLHTADINFAQSFTEPQTITTEANTTWRAYSYPVQRNGIREGVILTAYYDPSDSAIDEIDTILRDETKKIDSLLEYNQHGLSATKLEPRFISHGVYYSVIDNYNRVLSEDGGPPAYVDRSFIAEFLKSQSPKEVFNEQTGEIFLISSYAIRDDRNNILGIIVTGESIKAAQDILGRLKKFSLMSGAVALLMITVLFVTVFGRELRRVITQKAETIIRESQKKVYISPQKIVFNTRESCLLFDTKKIPIEYGSKQYDLCKTLFSAPSKRWEYDELLDKNHLTEEEQSERTFYDASLRINNKLLNILGCKFIVYENKTYRLHPSLSSKVMR